MNIKKLFKKKSPEELLQEKESRRYLAQQNNMKNKMVGLAQLRTMPKGMQKLFLRTLPKKERDTAKRIISGELELSDLADPIVPDKPKEK